MHLLYLYSHHNSCEPILSLWSNVHDHKVYQGQVVHTYLILVLPNTNLHGNQVEHVQQLQQCSTPFPELFWFELCIAYSKQASGTIEPGNKKYFSYTMSRVYYNLLLAMYTEIRNVIEVLCLKFREFHPLILLGMLVTRGREERGCSCLPSHRRVK